MSGTTVVLADGTTEEIPSGERGTFSWVREANYIAKAYEQAGDSENALKWQREYQKRVNAWNQIQAGADIQAIVDSIGPDLTAPTRILERAGQVLSDAAGGLAQLPKAAVDLTKWIPAILLGLVVVLGLSAYRGNLGLNVSR